MASLHDTMLTWVSLVHAGTYLLGEVGLSVPEQDLLSRLDRARRPLRMVQLAERLYFSKAGITKMVDRLADAGLLERRPDPEDRRAVNLALTDAGTRRLAESRESLRDWVRANLAAHLGDTEIRELGRLLRKLLEGHDRWEGQMAHVRDDPPDAS